MKCLQWLTNPRFSLQKNNVKGVAKIFKNKLSIFYFKISTFIPQHVLNPKQGRLHVILHFEKFKRILYLWMVNVHVNAP